MYANSVNPTRLPIPSTWFHRAVRIERSARILTRATKSSGAAWSPSVLACYA